MTNTNDRIGEIFEKWAGIDSGKLLILCSTTEIAKQQFTADITKLIEEAKYKECEECPEHIINDWLDAMAEQIRTSERKRILEAFPKPMLSHRIYCETNHDCKLCHCGLEQHNTCLSLCQKAVEEGE